MAQQPTIRIPDLPNGAITDKDGLPTDEEQTFRQNLISLLQAIAGNEGLVPPQQTATNIVTIQNNTVNNPSGGAPTYTCQPGTIIYNSTLDTLMTNILVAGVPTFKTFTVV